MGIISKIKSLYWKLQDPTKYARHIGVKIGKNCLIATRNWSTEPYLVTIGDNVQVTQEVYFHTHGGAHVARFKIPNFDVFGKIVVEDNAYIGSGSHIMPGVIIGNNALIAAGSVVTRSVPPFEVWGGVPAKKIMDVNEYMEKNEKFNINTKNLSHSEKRHILLELPENMFIKK